MTGSGLGKPFTQMDRATKYSPSEHLPNILAKFLAANPSLNLDIEERESIDIGRALVAGAADVGIASTTPCPTRSNSFPSALTCSWRFCLAAMRNAGSEAAVPPNSETPTPANRR